MDNEIKETKEIANDTVMIGNPELIASAFNAIAACESYNYMTGEDAESLLKIKTKSLAIIEACIDELYEYAIS